MLTKAEGECTVTGDGTPKTGRRGQPKPRLVSSNLGAWMGRGAYPNATAPFEASSCCVVVPPTRRKIAGMHVRGRGWMPGRPGSGSPVSRMC